MAGITLAQAEAHLALWLEADEAVSSGQSYTYGSYVLTLADSKKIKDNLEYWDSKVRALSNSRTGIVIRGAAPV